MLHLPRFPKAGKNTTVDDNGRGLVALCVFLRLFLLPPLHLGGRVRAVAVPPDMICHTVFISFPPHSFRAVAECRTASLDFLFFFCGFPSFPSSSLLGGLVVECSCGCGGLSGAPIRQMQRYAPVLGISLVFRVVTFVLKLPRFLLLSFLTALFLPFLPLQHTPYRISLLSLLFG